ncbi:MAG: hypothetical protein ACOZBL_05330 [Patescibacteria group bacterium]|jgi:tetrahydromethanopterin S-methyltransferase subunit C
MEYHSSNEIDQISAMLKSIKTYVTEKNLQHPFNENNQPNADQQNFLSLVMELSVNRG